MAQLQISVNQRGLVVASLLKCLQSSLP